MKSTELQPKLMLGNIDALENFLVPASIIIISIVACFFVYLIVLRLKGYFPVFALVSREDSELIDILIEAQGKIRGGNNGRVPNETSKFKYEVFRYRQRDH